MSKSAAIEFVFAKCFHKIILVANARKRSGVTVKAAITTKIGFGARSNWTGFRFKGGTVIATEPPPSRKPRPNVETAHWRVGRISDATNAAGVFS